MPPKMVERRRGNRLGFWFFHAATRLTGLKGAYGLLYFVCLHYLLFDLPLVRESLPYVRRRFPDHGPLRQLFDLYLLFVNQGKCLLDRYAVASGYEGIDIEIRGYEELCRVVADSERGFILLTAHIGSWQVAMSCLQKFERDVRVMMRPEDNEVVKNALDLDSDREKIKVILTSEALGGVIEAMKAIDEGALVTIMGDRPYNFPSLQVDFLGDTVSFPYGAFTLAAAAKCPVVVFLSAKVDTEKYLVDVSNIIPPPSGPRVRKGEELVGAVQRYARILEEYVQDYPYQWFVFRDIWRDGGKGQPAVPTANSHHGD